MNTARQIATDVRNAYRQYWIALALAVTFTGLTIAYAVRGDWWAAVDELLFLGMFTVAIVNLHQRNQAESKADEYLGRWADLDEDLDEATNLLAVERVKNDKLEAAYLDSERDLREAVADLDMAAHRARIYDDALANTPTTGADIRRMCEAFGQDVHDQLHKPKPEVIAMRVALFLKEATEYLEAIGEGNIVHIAKEASDVLTVLYGDAAAFGYDLDAVTAETTRSNMTKIDPETGEPYEVHPNGKVGKGPHYSPPAVADVIGHMDGDPWSEQVAA